MYHTIPNIFLLELFIQNCWKQSRARLQKDHYWIESDVFSQCGADPSSIGRGLDSLKGHVLASSSATSTPSCWQSCAAWLRPQPPVQALPACPGGRRLAPSLQRWRGCAWGRQWSGLFLPPLTSSGLFSPVEVQPLWPGTQPGYGWGCGWPQKPLQRLLALALSPRPLRPTFSQLVLWSLEVSHSTLCQCFLPWPRSFGAVGQLLHLLPSWPPALLSEVHTLSCCCLSFWVHASLGQGFPLQEGRYGGLAQLTAAFSNIPYTVCGNFKIVCFCTHFQFQLNI